MSAAVDGKTGLAEELRRRRTALGWTLEQVAALSVQWFHRYLAEGQ